MSVGESADALMIKNALSRVLGFKLTYYKDDFIVRRVKARMVVLGVNNVLQYVNLIKTNREEMKKLLESLAIHVSEFFRDKEVWDDVKKYVFIPIIDRKKRLGSRIIKIWSAGCSKGEEPYTISIILHELLGPSINDYLIRIYATDIDPQALRDAEMGIYDAQQLRNVPRYLVNKYFERLPNGKYRIKEFIKKIVKFQKHDLTKDPPIPLVDAVFLRNVLIYIDKKYQIKILENIYKSLISEGYLVLGASEAVPLELTKKFKPVSLKSKIYKKV